MYGSPPDRGNWVMLEGNINLPKEIVNKRRGARLILLSLNKLTMIALLALA